jgi:hypothetical protein
MILKAGDDAGLVLHVMPAGVVALDIDSLDSRFWLGGMARDRMRSAACNMGAMIADLYGLGRFWVLGTHSGAHVIFERPVLDPERILMMACDLQPWHECGGHSLYAGANGYITLRVNPKPGRGDDLEFWFWPEPEPDFVREHRLAVLAWRGV